MDPKKRHDGYRSFSYLVEGEDYVAFDLVPELGRVEPFVVPLAPEDDERAERLLRESICVSLSATSKVGHASVRIPPGSMACSGSESRRKPARMINQRGGVPH